MVLLCLGGTGTVRVNGRAFELRRGAVFVLPWAHAIAYSAGAIDPFLVGGAHLVPRHDAGFAIRPSVPHGPRHDLAGCTWRNDAPELGGRDVVTTTATERPELHDVVVYAIGAFARGSATDSVMRALGTLMVSELGALSEPSRTAVDPEFPRDIRRVMSYVDRKLDAQLTVRELADVAGISEATLTRRFHTYLRSAPMNWITDRRIAHATELLRTTSLPVAQIARKCGVSDPYYFSRLFRKRVGESPSGWRRSHHLL